MRLRRLSICNSSPFDSPRDYVGQKKDKRARHPFLASPLQFALSDSEWAGAFIGQVRRRATDWAPRKTARLGAPKWHENSGVLVAILHIVGAYI